MVSPGSSIISAFGVGNGVNFVQLADDLSDATFAFQRGNLESRNETLEARISSASVLRNAVTDLSGALGDRIRFGDLSPVANFSNGSVARVTATPGLTPTGNYELEVSQLAGNQTIVSEAYSSSDDLVGEGNLRIRFGTIDGASFTEDITQTALDIAVDASDTLESLAAKITVESDGSLDAYVANGVNGAQLVIKGQDGAVNGFLLEPTSASGSSSAVPGDLTFIAFDPATNSSQLRDTAQDALFAIDTVAFSSASNTVTDLPEGLTFELTGTNVGAPTEISFENDPSEITGVISDLVVTLNAIVGLLDEEAAAQGGTLAGDPGARELRRDLSRLTTEVIIPGAGDDEPSTLSDLGVSLTRDGNFEFDAARLNETLASNPDEVAAMFTLGSFGVFATIDSFSRNNTLSSDPGSLGGSVARYESQIERNDERLTRIADQQESLRLRLTRDLIAAQEAVTQSQSTLDFLRLQFDQNNDSN